MSIPSENVRKPEVFCHFQRLLTYCLKEASLNLTYLGNEPLKHLMGECMCAKRSMKNEKCNTNHKQTNLKLQIYLKDFLIQACW